MTALAAVYALTGAVLWRGDPGGAVLALALTPLMIWITCADLDRFEIPDGAVLGLAGVAAVFLWATGGDLLWHILTGAAVTAVLWLAGAFYFRRKGHEALGIGDAKLFGAGAFLLGPWQLPDLFLLSSIGGIAAICVVRLSAETSHAKGVPFGPFIAYAIYILSNLDPLFL